VPDVVDAATRSRMMRGIRGSDTQPELRVRRRMHAAGLRFRLRSKDLPGRPDVVFRRIRTAVFVNGCFWHQHPGCKLAATPGSNVSFWSAKLRSNVDRDQKVLQQLHELGWTASVIWECSSDHDIDELISTIASRRAQYLRAHQNEIAEVQGLPPIGHRIDGERAARLPGP
jgi:DNA mismatch endonuclease (patch repair protein)